MAEYDNSHKVDHAGAQPPGSEVSKPGGSVGGEATPEGPSQALVPTRPPLFPAKLPGSETSRFVETPSSRSFFPSRRSSTEVEVKSEADKPFHERVQSPRAKRQHVDVVASGDAADGQLSALLLPILRRYREAEAEGAEPNAVLMVDASARGSDQLIEDARRRGHVVRAEDVTPSQLAEHATSEQVADIVTRAIPSEDGRRAYPTDRGIISRIHAALTTEEGGKPSLADMKKATGILLGQPRPTPEGLTEEELEHEEDFADKVRNGIFGGRERDQFFGNFANIDIALGDLLKHDSAAGEQQDQPDDEGRPELVIMRARDNGEGDPDILRGAVMGRLMHMVGGKDTRPGIPHTLVVRGAHEWGSEDLFDLTKLSEGKGVQAEVYVFDPEAVDDDTLQFIGTQGKWTLAGVTHGPTAEKFARLAGQDYGRRLSGMSKNFSANTDIRDESSTTETIGYKGPYVHVTRESYTKATSNNHTEHTTINSSTDRSYEVGPTDVVGADEVVLGTRNVDEDGEVTRKPAGVVRIFGPGPDGRPTVDEVTLAEVSDTGLQEPLARQLQKAFPDLQVGKAQDAAGKAPDAESTEPPPAYDPPSGNFLERVRYNRQYRAQVRAHEATHPQTGTRAQTGTQDERHIEEVHGQMGEAGLRFSHFVTEAGDTTIPDPDKLAPEQRDTLREFAKLPPHARSSIIRRMGLGEGVDPTIISKIIQKDVDSGKALPEYDDRVATYRAGRHPQNKWTQNGDGGSSNVFSVDGNGTAESHRRTGTV